MDTQQWQIFPMSDEAKHHRKRPWDVISTSTSAEVNMSRGHVIAFPDERESVHSPEWKRRRSIAQTESSSIWDTSMQTSLWLAQQNNLEPIVSMGRESSAHGHGARPPPEHEYMKRVTGPAHDQPREWPRYGDDVPKSSVDGHGLGVRILSTERPPARFDHPHQLVTSSAPDPHDVVASHYTRPFIATTTEQRCEKCFQDEAVWQESANCMSKLVESLVSGPLFDIAAQFRRECVRHEQIPFVTDVHRIFDLIQEANGLARHVLQTAPSYLQDEKESSSNDPRQANDLQSSLESMKRRFLADSQDGLKRQRRESVDVGYGHEAHSYSSLAHDSANADGPGRLSTTEATGDRLPPIRTHSPSQVSPDAFNSRLPSMKPPPTPSRQLPSPPGRSHPSPPSYNIPSPSSLLYGPQSATSTTAPPQQQVLNNILHPLSPTPSSSIIATNTGGTALQAHTAALQHEVSVKKYALQTLQSEHDKLLAALRRSQTRAHTLEEKQVNSDLEVNSLSEERARLLSQIAELELTITEVSKTRDEFRQAAVKEGAQYVKIVRMASRLEMMAGDERKEWKRQMSESKAKIEALQAGLHLAGCVSPPEASVEARVAYEGPVEELKSEVQRLQTRCAEFEEALKAIRTEGQRFGDAVATLGSAGGHILASVDAALLGSGSATRVSRGVSGKVISGPQLQIPNFCEGGEC